MNRTLLTVSGTVLLFLGPAAVAEAEKKPTPMVVPEVRGEAKNGAPIPTGGSVIVARDVQKISKAWCKRLMLDEYNKTPKPDPNVAQFIQSAIDEIHGLGPAPAKLKEEALFLLEAGVDDPLFLCLAAGVAGDARLDLYGRGLAGLEKSQYNKFIGYMTAVAVNQSLDAQKAPEEKQEIQFKITLDLLRAALQTDAFLPEEFVALVYRLDSKAGAVLFSKHATDVCAILRASPKVPLWVTEYYDGKREIDEAWKARGKDFANAVQPEGWKGFDEHLALARTHLVKSWKLNPAFPRAAAAMIKVAMGEETETEPMRTWFDRAVAAQLDYMPAYASMRWGLRPRWKGSVEAMTAFGEECLRTGRYDTAVPFEYVLAMKDVSGELEDKGAIFANPKVNGKLLEALNGYLASPDHGLDRKYLRAMAALVAYKGGKLDVAKKHLEEIDYNVKSWTNEFGRYVDVAAMVAELRKHPAK